MAVPDFQTLMLPLLRLAAQGKGTIRECIPEIAREFSLSDDDLSEMLPSGRQQTIANRLHWARTYLAKAGLLSTVKRGVFALSDTGRTVVESGRTRVDMKFLEQFEPYRRWRLQDGMGSSANGSAPHGAEAVSPVDSTPLATPRERIEQAHEELTKALADDLLDRPMDGTPAFFERAVVDLLTAMGYGGGREGAGQRLGRSGDGGIDGVINEDALGLDAVYVQAKRYAAENIVGRPAIQQFVGSLQGEGATKGVFVTTSGFSADAKRYVEKVPQRVVLIDGQRLARLMIANGVGVQAVETITLREIDENFFSED